MQCSQYVLLNNTRLNIVVVMTESICRNFFYQKGLLKDSEYKDSKDCIFLFPSRACITILFYKYKNVIYNMQPKYYDYTCYEYTSYTN